MVCRGCQDQRRKPVTGAFYVRFRWWNLPPEELTETLPLLCDPDLAKAKRTLQEKLNNR